MTIAITSAFRIPAEYHELALRAGRELRSALPNDGVAHRDVRVLDDVAARTKLRGARS